MKPNENVRERPKIEEIIKRIKHVHEVGRTRVMVQIVAVVVATKESNLSFNWIWNNTNKHCFKIGVKDKGTKDGLNWWHVCLINNDLRNGHRGKLDIFVRNEFGSAISSFDLNLKGFNVPFANGDPFVQQPNSDGHRMIGVVLNNVTRNEYTIRWFRDDVEIDEEDKNYEMSKVASGYGNTCSALLIKMPLTESEAVYKTIVENESGQFECEIDIRKTSSMPYLCGKVRVETTYNDSFYYGKREKMRVRIIVPFWSHTKYNMVRWSCNEKLVKRITKLENYQQHVEALVRDCYEVVLTFFVMSEVPEENRTYRCEIFNDIGKVTAYAKLKFGAVDGNLMDFQVYENGHSEKLSEEETNQPFYLLTNVEEVTK